MRLHSFLGFDHKDGIRIDMLTEHIFNRQMPLMIGSFTKLTRNDSSINHLNEATLCVESLLR
ncbi:hypothetical protein QFZ78_001000 [Paenibacillus sp. V4I5]|nr:hypothetical protein [Paenibacillus sp. V4I5]